MNIRQADKHDHGLIEALWEEAQLPTVTPEEWDVLLQGGAATVYVAEDEQGLAGAAVAAFDGWRAYIYHVAVDSVSRHKGVATALMEHAESELARRGAQVIYLIVHEANTAGLAMAARSGYQPQLGELVLVKELPQSPENWS